MRYPVHSQFIQKGTGVPGVLALTVIGLLLTAGTLYLQNKQLKRDLRKETDHKKIASDHGYAVACMMAIGRKFLTSVKDAQGNTFQSAAFPLVFNDQDLRRRIDMYLGNQNGAGDFNPHQLSSDQLGNPECCRTIRDVISAVEKARSEPWAGYLSLPPKRGLAEGQ
jgi:hypothetical protein